MSVAFNPIGDPFDFTNKADSIDDYGILLQFRIASLAAYDKIVQVNYADLGLKTQRVSSLVLSSSVFPQADVTKTVFWLDVGTMNQRVQKVEYAGGALAPQQVRKTYQYSAVGIKYKLDGFFFELF